jgi:hypothetical protein
MKQLITSIDWIQNLFHYLLQMIAPVKNTALFDDLDIDVKAYYLKEFRDMPSIKFIRNPDIEKAFAYINEGNAGKVLASYQRSYFDWDKKKQENARTVIKLKNRTVIIIADTWIQILFDKNNVVYADGLIEIFSACKVAPKEDDHEINIISRTSYGLELKQVDIKPTDLDIDMYYNDDFMEVDKIIKNRLANENDKGIILLHGLPGTGKTTYLRHLISGLKKKILFVSPAVAENLMNPEFIDILIDNPNAILIIEDADTIIMDRKFNSNSSVSNLLNISDGLLSDCLNVQIICTFNSAINLVDSALLRKGRLIAKYEFGKLNMQKAQRLNERLGLNQVISTAMTLAEITNPGSTNYDAPKVEVIGFRKTFIEN